MRRKKKMKMKMRSRAGFKDVMCIRVKREKRERRFHKEIKGQVTKVTMRKG